MARCPECGGEMISRNKRKICTICGLSLTGAEYDNLWEEKRLREKNENSSSKHREYLKWYFSTKEE